MSFQIRIKQVGAPISVNSYLWRYFDLQKFLSLVIDETIFFNRMDKMEDVNEGISINQLLLLYGDEIEKEIVRRNKEDRGKQELQLQTRQQKYFLSCWLVHHRESVAMWNSYSDNNGIALKINSKSLINAISSNIKYLTDGNKMETMYYGKIVYKDFFNATDRRHFKEEIEIMGFQKDESFAHEKEFRFLIKQNLHLHKKDEIPFVKLKIKNFKKLEFDLIYHPKMAAWKKQNIQNVLQAIGGTNFRLKDSELKLKEW